MRSLRKPLLVLALTAGLAAPALAQQPSGYPAPCDASKVTQQDHDRAHTVYLSGKQFLEESNYDKAISYFKDAYSIDCSVHGILPIIASAYERKGDKAEAIRALEEYLRRAPTASDREVIDKRIKNLRSQMPREAPIVTTKPAAAATAIPTATSAPTTTTTATATTTPTTTTTTTTTTTATATSAATETPPEPRAAHGTAPWIVVGGGGALVAGGLVMFVVGSKDVSNADAACPARRACPSDVAGQGNTGRTLETVGGVVGGLGVAAVAAGLVWHFTEKPSPSGAEHATNGGGSYVAPQLAPGYAGVSVGGAY